MGDDVGVKAVRRSTIDGRWDDREDDEGASEGASDGVAITIAGSVLDLTYGSAVVAAAEEKEDDAKADSENVTSDFTVIWLVVRVPVLSVQMTEVQPKVSTDGSLRTITFLLAIRLSGDGGWVMGERWVGGGWVSGEWVVGG